MGNSNPVEPRRMNTVPTKPYDDQNPGTSGLRKKVSVFRQPHYAENFIQSILGNLDDLDAATLVAGGDGRFLNREILQTVIAMSVANGIPKLIIGRGGLLSTPAASHLIRQEQAAGGIILSASHNPGGPDGDFGIKFNTANGGPAPAALTQKIFETSRTIENFRKANISPVDLDGIGRYSIHGTEVVVIDPVADYADLMSRLFDFDAIAQMFADGFTMRFDAMSAVTGPYARELFEQRLGAPVGTVINGDPLPDFGGGHPDPNPAHARQLYELMMSPDAPDFGAASDGDGDRNMILGRGVFVKPSDSLAILAANASLAPAYAEGLAGIARSMPTSAAADRVAEQLGIPLFETPTGWKYFGNLLDAGVVTICGEESAGTGSDHVREKDGIWAVLLWLNILARRREQVSTIVDDHWRRFGRNYYARHDYEGLSDEHAVAVMQGLRGRLATLQSQTLGSLRVEKADDFAYHDTVDGSVAEGQGIRFLFVNGGRIVFRLSGTGTSGATLRIYLERYEPPGGLLDLDNDAALSELVRAANDVGHLDTLTGRRQPTLIT
jgi:phosphoglucomutase